MSYIYTHHKWEYNLTGNTKGVTKHKTDSANVEIKHLQVQHRDRQLLHLCMYVGGQVSSELKRCSGVSGMSLAVTTRTAFLVWESLPVGVISIRLLRSCVVRGRPLKQETRGMVQYCTLRPTPSTYLLFNTQQR
jgi:hypothetical protein